MGEGKIERDHAYRIQEMLAHKVSYGVLNNRVNVLELILEKIDLKKFENVMITKVPKNAKYSKTTLSNKIKFLDQNNRIINLSPGRKYRFPKSQIFVDDPENIIYYYLQNLGLDHLVNQLYAWVKTPYSRRKIPSGTLLDYYEFDNKSQLKKFLLSFETVEKTTEEFRNAFSNKDLAIQIFENKDLIENNYIRIGTLY